MNILFVGIDRQVFVEGTEAYSRIKSYATIATQVHLIVFTKKSMGFKKMQLAPNVTVYPTQSRTKANYIADAKRMGKELTDIDVVSSQDPFECAFAAIPIARHHDACLQIQMHIDAFSPYFRVESVLNRVRPYMARYTLPKADCIRPVSERIKESVAKQHLKLKKEPTVLPVYVDVSRYESEEPTESLRDKYPQYKTLVLMAGRLVPQKDIPTALRAFERVHAEHPDAGLIMVGEGPDEEALKAHVAERGLEDCVQFEGWQKDMLSYMKTCDIFLMTSTHEGYQRALGEAAAAGVPVVTTEIGPVGSLYKDRDTVLSCPVGDDACIAGSLGELIENEKLRAALVKRARKLARTAIAPNYEEFLQVYKKLLADCCRS